jgi:hypothetical protein
MLGKFIAGEFIAIAGEMRRFPASNENTYNSASIPYNTSANNWGKRINLSFSQENVISSECIYAISISR